MNELTLAAAAIIGGLARELVRLVLFPFTGRQRNAAAAVQEADAVMDTAKAFEILAAQIVKSGDRSDKLFDRVVAMGERQDAEREMYRLREKERDEQHKALLATLEKSLIEANDQITDLNERIKNLHGIQDKLKVDYATQERLFKEQEHRIATLEESERQAHRLVIEKDIKITELEKQVRELEPLKQRVKELDAEIKQFKLMQAQPPADPARPDPLLQLFGKEDDPDPKPPKVSLTPEQQLEQAEKEKEDKAA